MSFSFPSLRSAHIDDDERRWASSRHDVGAQFVVSEAKKKKWTKRAAVKRCTTRKGILAIGSDGTVDWWIDSFHQVFPSLPVPSFGSNRNFLCSTQRSFDLFFFSFLLVYSSHLSRLSIICLSLFVVDSFSGLSINLKAFVVEELETFHSLLPASRSPSAEEKKKRKESFDGEDSLRWHSRCWTSTKANERQQAEEWNNEIIPSGFRKFRLSTFLFFFTFFFRSFDCLES